MLKLPCMVQTSSLCVSASPDVHVLLSFDIIFVLCSFYENIFNMSGAANLTEQYGDWFSWEGSPRSKIFARNHTSVANISTMVGLMRYRIIV